MKPAQHTFNLIRTILDFGLIAALLLIIISRALPVQADQLTVVPSGPPIGENVETVVTSDGANSPTVIELDNNTIAAIIAAENAALNPPQFMTDLPMITR